MTTAVTIALALAAAVFVRVGWRGVLRYRGDLLVGELVRRGRADLTIRETTSPPAHVHHH